MDKIEHLKKRLVKLTEGTWYNVYYILSQIYELRKKKNKNYSFKDLAHETIVKDYYSYTQIEYIMALRYATRETLKAVADDKLSLRSVLNALQKQEFRDASNQNAIFGWHRKKGRKELHKMNKFAINKILKGKPEIEMEQRTVYIMRCLYELRSINEFIKENGITKAEFKPTELFDIREEIKRLVEVFR